VKHSVVTLLALSTVATTTVAHGAPRIGCVCPNCFRQRRRGDVMLAVGVLAAAAALVLGLRFSVVTLVLLTLATVINFATSVFLGGSGPLVVGFANVGDACFCPNQLPRWLPACSASSRASRATSSTACECAALHSGNTFQERLKAAVLVIVRSFSIRKIRLSDAWP